MKHRGLTLVVAAASLSLVACSSESDTYCERFAAAGEQLAAINSGDFSQIDQAIDELAQVQDNAPEAVADQWAIYNDSIQTLQDAVSSNGLTVEGLLAIAQDPEPTDEEIDLYMAVEEAMGELDLAALDAASAEISAHALEECGDEGDVP